MHFTTTSGLQSSALQVLTVLDRSCNSWRTAGGSKRCVDLQGRNPEKCEGLMRSCIGDVEGRPAGRTRDDDSWISCCKRLAPASARTSNVSRLAT
ncbi:unnamed protein product, partial [Lampetra fluviatilis]